MEPEDTGSNLQNQIDALQANIAGEDQAPRGRGRKDDVVTVARPVDGAGTNPDYPDWGAVGQTLLRLADARYADGIGEMMNGLPNPRDISNAVSQQSEDEPNSFGLSDLFWAWGQFIDHDLDLTEAGETTYEPIPVPVGDPFFDPQGLGEAVIPFFRVDPVHDSGVTDTRSYENEITSFLDASMVYGSDIATAASLRTDGGKLLLDDQGFLIETGEGGVLAGDIRAAENVALTSLHTLFAREHNRIVDELAAENPDLTDDELFAAARQRVEAEIQAITFNEFLPLLVGKKAIEKYDGYDEEVNPGISVEFSTAAFRFGHTLLSSEIQRLNEDGSVIAAGNLALADAFFSPEQISENGGIDPILRGLADGTAQEIDTQVVEDVRSFLFGAPGSGGLDLASLNIQRGRDLGVASYNDLREALGLARAQDFSDITSDSELAAQLADVYGDVDLVDAWIGGLAEDPYADGVIGETFATIIIDQFMRIRDGDPYWSQAGGLAKDEVRDLWGTTLADIIEANTEVDTVQDNAFLSYDRVSGTGSNDVLMGSDGRDLLLGLAGDDELLGGRGDDQLEGGDGNDELIGGAGRDVLDGGSGNDQLTGGTGKDRFSFVGTFGDDTISDFGTDARNADRIGIETDLFETVDELFAAAEQVGSDVILDFEEAGSITLANTSLSSLGQDDFLLI
ncbi:MAG: peroxidase [Roseibium sp.]|uniref:peroxidase family protein n=1 Tax=Roseibium sp. TaxID=1936156 RepID=UPI00261E8AB9|nr:peroxidase family protein [Roseibium sp.]MCV0424366.1 peroxidase [Roseibium sp.]